MNSITRVTWHYKCRNLASYMHKIGTGFSAVFCGKYAVFFGNIEICNSFGEKRGFPFLSKMDFRGLDKSSLIG